MIRNKALSALLFSTTLLIADNALSSRAKVMVMGSGEPTGLFLDPNGNGGSFYYDTIYSTLISPTAALKVSDQLLIEKSNFPAAAAQGAAAKKVGPVNLVGFFGRRGDAGFYARSTHMRPTELYAATSLGSFDLGLGLSYFGSGQKDQKSDRDIKIRTGVDYNWEEISVGFFGDIKADGRDRSSGTEFRHYDYKLGLKAAIYDIRAIGGYRRYWRKKSQEMVRDVFGVGFSHKTQVDEKTEFYYGIGFWRETSAKNNIVPIHFAIEHDVLSWLILRGGLGFQPYNVARGNSALDNTSGRLGATIHKDRFSLDWVVGSNVNGTEAAATPDSQSFGFDSGSFTAVALNVEL